MWRRDDRRPRILYLSRDGILDGLGESQVLGYVSGLSRDHRFWVITFEKSFEGAGSLRGSLSAQGIEWRPFRFYGRSTPLRAAWGLGRFFFLALGLVIKNRIRIINARSNLPCLVALLVRLFSLGYTLMLFDTRGFWIDERAEAGEWQSEKAIYRIGKRIKRLLLRRSAEIVTLTSVIRERPRLLSFRPASTPTASGRHSACPN